MILIEKQTKKIKGKKVFDEDVGARHFKKRRGLFRSFD